VPDLPVDPRSRNRPCGRGPHPRAPLTRGIGLLTALALPTCTPDETRGPASPYPRSTVIDGIELDWDTWVQRAEGSDNWPLTWAGDDHQYTTWGDGGGFGGTNEEGRTSLGVARIEGGPDSYTGRNVWGGLGGAPPEFGGKSYGILSLHGVLYMWRCGNESDESAYDFQVLHRSSDGGTSWEETGVEFRPTSFAAGSGFFCPAFLQYGRDFEGARDGYVYAYAPEIKTPEWDVHTPGEITLLRAPTEGIEDRGRYEFFAGFDDGGQPRWTPDPDGRAPVFEDPENGVMRTSVTYNEGLGRYLLATEHTSSHAGNLGLFEAPEPWGPWSTIVFQRRFGRPVLDPTAFFWAFSNKWASEDGTGFVMVFSGTGSNDAWNSVEGRFVLSGSPGSP